MELQDGRIYKKEYNELDIYFKLKLTLSLKPINCRYLSGGAAQRTKFTYI